MICGDIQENGDMVCPHCDGNGFRILVDDNYSAGVIQQHCKICQGTGKTNWIDLIVPKPIEYIGFSGFFGSYMTKGSSGYGFSGFSGSYMEKGSSGYEFIGFSGYGTGS
jgi:hypothetical protein